MARPTGLSNSQLCEVRTGAAIIAADNGSLVDANYPESAALNCAGFDSIFVGVEITGGSSPTMTIEALFRDADAADGARWKKLLLGSPEGVTVGAAAAQTTGALAPDTTMAELRVFGRSKVFLRVSAVANATSTTAWKILAMPGRTRNIASLNRS